MLVALVLFLASCRNSGIYLEQGACVLDPASGVSYCYPTDRDFEEVKIEDMTGFTCFSVRDTQTIIEELHRRGMR